MHWFETASALSNVILRGDTQRAVDRISEVLRSLPETPYHKVLELTFTNPPQEIADHFERFLTREMAARPVGAVYTETNGFDINPDRWYFDLFSYEKHGGHKNFDWLADWQSARFPDKTLTGMETLQKVYDTEDMCRPDWEDAMYHCSLLVVAKFQDLIRQAVPLIKDLNVPVLATGHEYDFIAEFRPGMPAGEQA